jgi:hypothetical protein
MHFRQLLFRDTLTLPHSAFQSLPLWSIHSPGWMSTEWLAITQLRRCLRT